LRCRSPWRAREIKWGIGKLHRADDAVLVAQSQLEGLTLVTRDHRLGAYGIAHLRA
jgi:PIN domain nuclease of toxin-antitoxin system